MEIAKPFMSELSKETSASVFLTARVDEQAICIARVDSPKPLRVTFEVGRRSAMHAGASARAILAFLPEEKINSVIDSGLEAYTGRTLADPEKLRASLAESRRLGYTFSDGGELDEGVSAIGVPVMNGNNLVLASLSISGPNSDFTPERKEFLVRKTQESAAAIQNALHHASG